MLSDSDCGCVELPEGSGNIVRLMQWRGGVTIYTDTGKAFYFTVCDGGYFLAPGGPEEIESLSQTN